MSGRRKVFRLEKAIEDLMSSVPRHASSRPLKLVREIIDVVHKLTTRKPPPYVVGVDELVHAMGDRASNEFDEAMAFAVRAKLLLSDNGEFPSAVSLTDDGLTLAVAGGHGNPRWGDNNHVEQSDSP